jgi:murein DD-endopeptidase MepM/ murein hydrolase activator NlpD
VELFRGVEEGGDGGPQPILFASVTTGGATTTYYRFQTPDGVVKYYNADGYSADNFLLRKPMSGGELRSHYGMRLHPVLGVYRMHAGVDWSAPRGTPLVAAGDGLIVQMEYNSGGYGYYTVIRHELGYETAYAHQSGFAPGLAEGDTVRQGQVIGFVGSTGLSTGNHLHYEVRINGQTVNPLTVRLPEGRVLTGDELVAFQEQRDQINALLGFQPGTEIAAAP